MNSNLSRRMVGLLAGSVLAAYGFSCGASPPTDDGVAAAAAKHYAATSDPNRAGIWKAATPPAGSMHGEFAGDDPFGLAVGAKIPADCSINWVDPDTSKLYCFSSATSLVYFLEAPHTFLARARKNWDGAGS